MSTLKDRHVFHRHLEGGHSPGNQGKSDNNFDEKFREIHRKLSKSVENEFVLQMS